MQGICRKCTTLILFPCQCRAPGGSFPFSNPLPNYPEFSRAKAAPAGAASPGRCRQLNSCGKCSKIHLTVFWEISNFQTDCICATLTPYFLRRQCFFASLIFIYLDWDPTPAVPGNCQQESNFLCLMSTQKFWEQFQRPRRNDTLVTTPREHYPVGS